MPKLTKKRVLMTFLFVIGFIVVIEILALINLYLDVTRYYDYWQKKSQEPGTFIYVALGDSAAQGLGASSPDKGYVGLIGKKLNQTTGKEIKIINLSKSGAVVQDVIDKQIPKLQQLKPDLVTVEIGANDIGSFKEQKFKDDFTELASLLPDDSYVSNMPYFGSRSKKRPDALRSTEIIDKILNLNPKLHRVDLQTITQQRNSIWNYAPDYFHPNNRAYKNWEEAFWKEIQPNLDTILKNK